MTDTLRGLPENDLVAILGGNAARVYDIDPVPLQSLVNRIGPQVSDFADR